jgi:hypothetical protein
MTKEITKTARLGRSLALTWANQLGWDSAILECHYPERYKSGFQSPHALLW